MDSIELITFLLLGLAAAIFKAYNRKNLIDFLQLMFFASVALLIKNDLSSTDHNEFPSQITYGLIGVVAINLVISKWKGYHRPLLRVLPPLITFVAFWIFFGQGELTYLSSSVSLSGIALMSIPFLGVLAYEIGSIKSILIKKLFDSNENLANSIALLVIGVSVLIAVFNAGGFGVLLIAAGYLSASFYRSSESKQLTNTLLALSLIWMFSNVSDTTEADLGLGKTLTGLFIGAFTLAMIQFSWSAKKRKYLLVIIASVIGFGLILMMLLMQLQHNAFGGMEAFIGVVVGFALTNALIGKPFVGMSVLAIIIAIGLYFPAYLINQEQQAIEKELEIFGNPKKSTEEVEEIKTLPLVGIIGKYEVDIESSLISFKLGPKGGVTKGAIKNFSGSIEIKEDILASSFNIEMPIKALTTFNKMRDDALNGREYFNSKAFKKMIFTGKSLKETSAENEYEIVGEFTLLGVTKEVTVIIMRVDNSVDKILIGKGSIDRTEFGMTPDSRQGNVVSFEFKVKLI